MEAVQFVVDVDGVLAVRVGEAGAVAVQVVAVARGFLFAVGDAFEAVAFVVDPGGFPAFGVALVGAVAHGVVVVIDTMTRKLKKRTVWRAPGTGLTRLRAVAAPNAPPAVQS